MAEGYWQWLAGLPKECARVLVRLIRVRKIAPFTEYIGGIFLLLSSVVISAISYNKGQYEEYSWLYWPLFALGFFAFTHGYYMEWVAKK